MPRLPLTLLTASLLTASGLATAAETHIPAAAVQTATQLRDKAMADDTGYQIVASLTTEIGPRIAGGVNDQRARDWAIAKFKQLGYDKVYTEAVTYPLWQRRSEHGSIVAPFPQPLTLTALGFSAGTPKGGLTADVIKFDSLDALKAADPASVKGRIVYIGFRMTRQKDGHDYAKGTAIRTGGPAIASSKGAAGFILRSAGTDPNSRTPHAGMTMFKDPAQAIPAAALSNPDADQLERVLAYGKPVRVKLDLDCGLAGTFTGANVIGEITGRKHPEQVVDIGGHLDSWDLGTGAIDDGAGVVVSMQAIHLLSQLGIRPKRTVRFIAWMAEEEGSQGAETYARDHTADIANHIGAIETDSGAGHPTGIYFSGKPALESWLRPVAQTLQPIGANQLVSTPETGEDIATITSKGVPGFAPIQDSRYYFNYHHTAADTVDKVDAHELNENAAVVTVLAYAIADASEPAPR
jgi:Peptidase family M28